MSRYNSNSLMPRGVVSGMVLHAALGVLTGLAFLASAVATLFVIFGGAPLSLLWLWATFAGLLVILFVNFGATAFKMFRA